MPQNYAGNQSNPMGMVDNCHSFNNFMYHPTLNYLPDTLMPTNFGSWNNCGYLSSFVYYIPLQPNFYQPTLNVGVFPQV
jgi:hypothetical protein